MSQEWVGGYHGYHLFVDGDADTPRSVMETQCGQTPQESLQDCPPPTDGVVPSDNTTDTTFPIGGCIIITMPRVRRRKIPQWKANLDYGILVVYNKNTIRICCGFFFQKKKIEKKIYAKLMEPHTHCISNHPYTMLV